MRTEHEVHIGSSQDMSELEDDSVDLVVTSPPYPMVEMWDEQFTEINHKIGEAIERGNGELAFRWMHDELMLVWSEIDRVLAPGGTVVINIGDSTRSIGGQFRLFENHAKVIEWFTDNGFRQLPSPLWCKPTNNNGFKGSGMQPPNGYVSNDNEDILIFRKGENRDPERRKESAYFWEERNEWFRGVWQDIQGASQDIVSDDLRDRSAAYPFEVPHRLINMYSTYGDTVLDPFWGTGTTTMAAMVNGRNSVGYELVEGFVDAFASNLSKVESLSKKVQTQRLRDHQQFMDDRNGHNHVSDEYGFGVVTKDEKPMKLYGVEEVTRDDGVWVLDHSPIEFDGTVGQSDLGEF